MTEKIRYLNLSVSEQEQSEILPLIKKVFNHGILVNGPEVEIFEKKIATFCNRKFAIGVSSGTDALYFALRSLDIGVGDEVITTSMSWIATANAIALCGAKPVFADVNDDLNISVQSIEKLITPFTKAILPVHYMGKVANMDEIINLAKRYNLKVIEDASQAFGAKRDGKVSGSFGDIACFSLNPMKILAACGEAGVLVTDDETIYNRIVSLRYNGTINKETCLEASFNGRIDTIQAAILTYRLNKVDEVINKRRFNASLYNNLLSSIKEVTLPIEKNNERDVFYTYTIRIKNRTSLMEYLEKNNVEVKVYHSILMGEQPAYKNKELVSDINNAKNLIEEILCLPIYESISEDEIVKVAKLIKIFYS